LEVSGIAFGDIFGVREVSGTAFGDIFEVPEVPSRALGDLWVTLGCPRGSLSDPGSIFEGFWVSFGRAWDTILVTNPTLDHHFSRHVFVMVPGSIFNTFEVFRGPPGTGKSIQIHATIVKNQGLSKFGRRWVRDGSGVDF
jgi:hypothetical protein